MKGKFLFMLFCIWLMMMGMIVISFQNNWTLYGSIFIIMALGSVHEKVIKLMEDVE